MTNFPSKLIRFRT